MRVVARQRKGGGASAIDKRYILGKFGSFEAYHRYRNESMKKYQAAYHKRRWREDPEYRERQQKSARQSYIKRRDRQREERAT